MGIKDPPEDKPQELGNIPQDIYITTKSQKFVEWARKYSLWQYPFVTACCGLEYMSTASAHYDTDRFGSAFVRFSPRQADLLFIVGTITHKQSPVLRKVYEQMCEPKWVIAFGVCASTGGFYQNYATVAGADRIVPVDVYIPGCPPRPEAVLEGLMALQKKIQLYQATGKKETSSRNTNHQSA